MKVDPDVLGGPEPPDKLRRKPTGIEKLVRYGGRVAKDWPIPQEVSCSWPLYLHYKYIKTIGQIHLAKTLKRLLGVIKHNWKKFLLTKGTSLLYTTEPEQYIDDYFRQKLKQLSSWAFLKVFEEGPAFMFLTHLHALTGKAPYTEQQIVSDIESWVSDRSEDGKAKRLDKAFWDQEVRKIFDTWYRGEAFGHLSFLEFCNDPYRWGTSGGAKATVWLGSKYRTKWAWAYERMTNEDGTLREEYNLYQSAVSEYNDDAVVALKEEAQKTREIITTPMPSYLRQAYLLYRWGKPNISSPVANPTWVAHFETVCPKWYGCLDGERFDHSIPADVVIDVVNRLGELDEETREVAKMEVKHLNKLRVHWKGKSWRWLGGLLSGWRLTSLIGSIVSEVAARYIIREMKMEGGVEHGVLGDDIVLYSTGKEISKEDMVRLYSDYGLHANLNKTVSGPVGEFLRKVVSSGGSWGYPALALRSVVYANPWISNYSFEKEQELASTWLTFISRLVPHRSNTSTLEEKWDVDIVNNLENVFGPGQWKRWLRTPQSAGGGGPVEFMSWDWVRLVHEKKGGTADDDRLVIPSLLGIAKSNILFEPVPNFKPVNITTAINDAKAMASFHSPPSSSFKHEVQVLPNLIRFLFKQINRSELNDLLTVRLPRSIRGEEPSKIITFLLSGFSEKSGYVSILHSKESESYNASLSKYVSRAVASSKKFNNPGIYGPAVTMYYLQTYRKHQIPAGTW